MNKDLTELKLKIDVYES
jgi:chromosome segregation ATPase